jgi:hypothetical protein
VLTKCCRLDYADASEYAPDEVEDFFAEGLMLLNATRFAALSVLRDDTPHLSLRQAAIMLQDGADKPYNDENRSHPREWKVLLPPAATWLIIAGELIYKSCLRGEAERSTYRFFEDRYLRKDRWEHWRTQLRALATRDDLDDDCRGIAAHAVERMAQIEEGYGARDRST